MPLPITPNLTWCPRCPRSPRVLQVLKSQAGTAPCPLQGQGSFPARGRNHPQGSLLHSSFSCRCVRATTQRHPQTPPALPSSHKAHPSWHFGVPLCSFLQETPKQTPFLQLGGALGRRRRKRCEPSPGAEFGHRAGPVGPVGPAGPCPWHQTRRARPCRCPCPSPAGSSAWAPSPLISHRPRKGHPGCGGPVPPQVPGPAALQHLQRSQPGFIPIPSGGIRGIWINPSELSTECQTPAPALPC